MIRVRGMIKFMLSYQDFYTLRQSNNTCILLSIYLLQELSDVVVELPSLPHKLQYQINNAHVTNQTNHNLYIHMFFLT